ncbi:MAG: hypothetical protein HUJ30_04385 [Gammaproteobacteria bacterium]|nr:hypothetical protein [Gammaproteobacteria bacterium]
MSNKDNYQINNEDEYHKALSTLSKASQPSVLLRLIMNAFERYRAARKMGWSRPWNKYDLLNFQSFVIKPDRDQALIQQGIDCIHTEFPQLPEEASHFIDDLISDPELMGFIFCHDFQENGKSWEGATLSLGRKIQRRYRDRIDIIFESEISQGESQGLGRIRLFIDPYRDGPGKPLYQQIREDNLSGISQLLFMQLSNISWENDTSRIWDHWTSRYIDYFGPRSSPLTRSYFLLPNHPSGQLHNQADEDHVA